MARTYITVSIPYVNARPHVGYALELVEADVLARQRRATGGDVRFLGGTDDHALKNVLGAEAAGVPTQDFVDANAAAFEALRDPLRISFDDFIRTSRDPRHRAGVERLWRASAANGDFYRQLVRGPVLRRVRAVLRGVRAASTVAVRSTARRRRRSRRRTGSSASPGTSSSCVDLIEAGTLEIVPETYRNEVLAFLAGGLDDISVSRSQTRARGWGIPVPDDPSQVIYVWWDALGNYVTALDYGTDGDAFDTWWRTADERIHVVGKGIVRFHAVYWPAMLLSAGELPPTKIYVHPYLTAEGREALASRPATRSTRSRSSTRSAPTRCAGGCCATCPAPSMPTSPSSGWSRGPTRISRTASGTSSTASRRWCTDWPTARRPPRRPPSDGDDGPCRAEIDAALLDFDFRRAVGVVRDLVDATNRRVDETRPWKLERGSTELADALGELVASARLIGELLTPFLPDTSARVVAALTPGVDGRLPDPEPVVQLLEPANH